MTHAVSLVGATLAVAIAATACWFSFGPGLVDKNGRPTASYNSTGGDDDIRILFAVPVFTLVAVIHVALSFIGRPGSGAIVFTAAWLFQSWLLLWIEVGSIPVTLKVVRNPAIPLFFAVFASALPVVWVTRFISARRSSGVPHNPPVQPTGCASGRRSTLCSAGVTDEEHSRGDQRNPELGSANSVPARARS